MLMKVVSRSTVFATIIALTLASISAISVFAAGPVQRNARTADQNLTQQWQHDITVLRVAKFMDSNVGKWTAEWMESKPSSTNKAKESRFSGAAAVAFQQAENLSITHPGFNDKGDVTDRSLAEKTIDSIELSLHQLHVDLIDKLLSLFNSNL